MRISLGFLLTHICGESGKIIEVPTLGLHDAQEGPSTYQNYKRIRSRLNRELLGSCRRVALALTLGFADVVAARGRLSSNLIVMDEVRGLLHVS